MPRTRRADREIAQLREAYAAGGMSQTELAARYGAIDLRDRRFRSLPVIGRSNAHATGHVRCEPATFRSKGGADQLLL